jgi:hypothetical protein
MANELTIATSLSYTKSPVSTVALNEAGKTISVNGIKYVRGVQAIGTAAEAIDLGDVATPGWFFLRNLDSTNYVDILTQVAGGAAFLRLKPGELAIGRFAVAAPAAQANGAAVNLEYMIIED